MTLLAQNATNTSILESKYVVADNGTGATDARSCRSFLQIPFEYQNGQPPAMTYTPPVGFASPDAGRSFAGLLVGLTLGAIGLAVAVDLFLLKRLRAGAGMF